MSRVTQSQVNEVFKHFAKTMGRSTVAWERSEDGNGYTANVGAWILDYNPTYGGYVINEMFNDGGAVTLPLTETRMSGSEIVQAMRFAMRCIQIKETDD